MTFSTSPAFPGNRSLAPVLLCALAFAACGGSEASRETTPVPSSAVPSSSEPQPSLRGRIEHGELSSNFVEVGAYEDSLWVRDRDGARWVFGEEHIFPDLADFGSAGDVWIERGENVAEVQTDPPVRAGNAQSPVALAYRGGPFWVAGSELYFGEQTVTRDPALAGTRALLRAGGSLYLGGTSGLFRLSLSGIGEEGSRVEQTLETGEPVIDLARDDLGLLLVLVESGNILRVLPDGTTSTLPLRADAMAFANGHLLVVKDDAYSVYRYAELLGETRPDSGRVGPFEHEGVALTGCEYWPSRDASLPNYPEDILWGFYPREGETFDGAVNPGSASEAAIACMEESHAALRSWIETHGALLRELAGLRPEYYSARFYLWVDDYSQTNDAFSEEMRPAQMWYWKRDPDVLGRIPGYWKWETQVTRDGACIVPDSQAAEELVRTALEEARAGNSENAQK